MAKTISDDTMHQLLDDSLLTWQEFASAALRTGADKKALIKLPCELTMQDGEKVNSICFIKDSDVCHTVFTYFEDNHITDFCVTKDVVTSILEHNAEKFVNDNN